MSEEVSITELYQLYAEKSELLHRFAEKLNQYSAASRDYGSKMNVTMAEVHVLTSIADAPGVTAAELAQLKNKTPSAISQILKRLENADLVERRPHPTHGKKFCLYVTEEGKRLSDLRKSWDVAHIQHTFENLLRFCSIPEIDTFFHVITAYCSNAFDEAADSKEE